MRKVHKGYGDYYVTVQRKSKAGVVYSHLDKADKSATLYHDKRNGHRYAHGEILPHVKRGELKPHVSTRAR